MSENKAWFCALTWNFGTQLVDMEYEGVSQGNVVKRVWQESQKGHHAWGSYADLNVAGDFWDLVQHKPVAVVDQA